MKSEGNLIICDNANILFGGYFEYYYFFQTLTTASMGESAGNSLSVEGVKSDEYMAWKKETLAIQKSHKEGQQRTGLWQDFGDVKVKTRDPNEYVIELSPGWR